MAESHDKKTGTEKQSPAESTWWGCMLQWGSITSLAEASRCLADVIMMLPLSLEVESRREWKRQLPAFVAL